MNVPVELHELQALADIGQESRPGLAGDSLIPRTDNVVLLWNACPHSEEVTEYDQRNIYLYGLLLEAEFEGASERRMAEVFFRIPFERRPDWALNVVRSHLARAHWLKKNFYPWIDW
jgi:hypothetical protein